MKGISDLFNVFKRSNILHVVHNKSIETEPNIQKSRSTLLKQVLVALGPLLLTVNTGMITGYSAILLPQLQLNNNTAIEIDSEEASWIASLAVLPMAIGSIFGMYFSEQFGRKTTHSMCSVPLTVAWLLIYLATSTKLILIGRFVGGLCSGLLATCTGVYIGETSEPKYRGFLLGGISFAISLGLLIIHLLGTFLHWQTTALICSVLPLISLVALLSVPESPSWLLKKGKLERAKHSFQWCRGDSDEANNELQVMLHRQETQQTDGSLKITLTYLKEPEFLKPLGIIVVYIIANQWVGVNAITFYTVTIMKSTVGQKIDEYLAMIIIDFIRLVMSIVACALLRKFCRRPLALISGVGTTVSLFAVGVFIYLSNVYPELAKQSFIPMLGLIAYITFISIGFVPLPWALIGELFPLKTRSIGSGITSFMAFIAFFSVVKTSPSMFENLGSSVTFLIYCLVAFVGTVFIYFCVPETKGKVLHEIEDCFKNKGKGTEEGQ